jgi:hypothetical protein
MSQNFENIKATASQTIDEASNKASEGLSQAHASGLEAKGQVEEQASGLIAQASTLAQSTVDYAKGMKYSKSVHSSPSKLSFFRNGWTRKTESRRRSYHRQRSC